MSRKISHALVGEYHALMNHWMFAVRSPDIPPWDMTQLIRSPCAVETYFYDVAVLLARASEGAPSYMRRCLVIPLFAECDVMTGGVGGYCGWWGVEGWGR